MIQVTSFDGISSKHHFSRKFSTFETALGPVKELFHEENKQEQGRIIRQDYDLNDFILVKNDYKLIKIQVKDIEYVEGKGNYVSLKIGKTKILTHQTMKKLEEFLSLYQFVRIHKSFIVSFHHIHSIDNQMV